MNSKHHADDHFGTNGRVHTRVFYNNRAHTDKLETIGSGLARTNTKLNIREEVDGLEQEEKNTGRRGGFRNRHGQWISSPTQRNDDSAQNRVPTSHSDKRGKEKAARSNKDERRIDNSLLSVERNLRKANLNEGISEYQRNASNSGSELLETDSDGVVATAVMRKDEAETMLTKNGEESTFNVWKERAELYRDAQPKDLEEDERMLSEALIMSQLQYEEEKYFRSLDCQLDNQLVVKSTASDLRAGSLKNLLGEIGGLHLTETCLSTDVSSDYASGSSSSGCASGSSSSGCASGSSSSGCASGSSSSGCVSGSSSSGCASGSSSSGCASESSSSGCASGSSSSGSSSSGSSSSGCASESSSSGCASGSSSRGCASGSSSSGYASGYNAAIKHESPAGCGPPQGFPDQRLKIDDFTELRPRKGYSIQGNERTADNKVSPIVVQLERDKFNQIAVSSDHQKIIQSKNSPNVPYPFQPQTSSTPAVLTHIKANCGAGMSTVVPSMSNFSFYSDNFKTIGSKINSGNSYDAEASKWCDEPRSVQTEMNNSDEDIFAINSGITDSHTGQSKVLLREPHAIQPEIYEEHSKLIQYKTHSGNPNAVQVKHSSYHQSSIPVSRNLSEIHADQPCISFLERCSVEPQIISGNPHLVKAAVTLSNSCVVPSGIISVDPYAVQRSTNFPNTNNPRIDNSEPVFVSPWSNSNVIYSVHTDINSGDRFTHTAGNYTMLKLATDPAVNYDTKHAFQTSSVNRGTLQSQASSVNMPGCTDQSNADFRNQRVIQAVATTHENGAFQHDVDFDVQRKMNILSGIIPTANKPDSADTLSETFNNSKVEEYLHRIDKRNRASLTICDHRLNTSNSVGIAEGKTTPLPTHVEKVTPYYSNFPVHDQLETKRGKLDRAPGSVSLFERVAKAKDVDNLMLKNERSNHELSLHIKEQMAKSESSQHIQQVDLEQFLKNRAGVSESQECMKASTKCECGRVIGMSNLNSTVISESTSKPNIQGEQPSYSSNPQFGHISQCPTPYHYPVTGASHMGNGQYGFMIAPVMMSPSVVSTGLMQYPTMLPHPAIGYSFGGYPMIVPSRLQHSMMMMHPSAGPLLDRPDIPVTMRTNPNNFPDCNRNCTDDN